MEEIIILIVFYGIFMFGMSGFIWGNATEKAWDFHKNMYFGRMLGQKGYYLFSKILAIVCMVGATAGAIAVLISKFR